VAPLPDRGEIEESPAWSRQELVPIEPLIEWREEIVTTPAAPPTAPEAPRFESRPPSPEPPPPPAPPPEPPPPLRDLPPRELVPPPRPAPMVAPPAAAPHASERSADDLRRAGHVKSASAPTRSFLSRAGFVLWLAFIVFGLAVTPRAVGDLVQRDELPEARVTRERIGQRLAALRDQFVLLAQDVDEETRRVEKVRIAYGLTSSPQRLPESPVDPRAFPNSVFRPLIEETAMLSTHARIAVVELEARVAALRAFESSDPDRVALTPGLSPLEGEFVMTSPFGYRKSAFTEEQEYHSGVDLAAAVGTRVIAPADGRVVFVGRFPVTRDSTWWRLGNVVAVRHGDDLLTLYGHLGRILVRSGENVKRGDPMSEIGESGVIANPHLHYAVWRRVAGGSLEPVDARLMMLDRQWDDEDELLANAAQRPRPDQFEPLPRQVR
jgi:murein DD-endopeptidase MepM/ murein hydrolase activator NlpD